MERTRIVLIKNTYTNYHYIQIDVVIGHTNISTSTTKISKEQYESIKSCTDNPTVNGKEDNVFLTSI